MAAAWSSISPATDMEGLAGIATDGEGNRPSRHAEAPRTRDGYFGAGASTASAVRPPLAGLDNATLAAQHRPHRLSECCAYRRKCLCCRSRRGESCLPTALSECNEIAQNAIFVTS